MNEEVLNTNVPETDATVNVVETETKPTTEENPTPKTYTQDEVDKLVQSERSKSKYEILKALDIKGVEDYRTKMESYESKIKEYDSLKQTNTELTSKIEELNKSLIIEKLGVNEEYKDDLITLANTKVSKDVTFEDAAKSIMERYPQWHKQVEGVKMGTEKANVATDPSTVSKEMLERFPWLKN